MSYNSLLSKISVAPMLDCTDQHFRYLMRLITRMTLLYTEMLTIKEVLNHEHILELNPIEPPIAIQLGGSQPQLLAQCAILAQKAGYNEVNLNVGCPSERVQHGSIGACLMLQPQRVAECIDAMQSQVCIPVSVKCRLGVDDQDSYEHLENFIDIVSTANCNKFIIHARKAWLRGLSPKQNRDLPPLDYSKVYRIKRDFPHLQIVINGGILTLNQAQEHLVDLDGVMIGRAVYHNPYLLAGVDNHFYSSNHIGCSQQQIVLKYAEYMEQQLQRGVKLSSMSRHLLGFFQNQPRAKYWRKHLSHHSSKKGVSARIVEAAMAEMSIS